MARCGRVDGWSAGQRQSHELLPRITALLQADRQRTPAVSALAVGIGPGSFTGLRVSMSVAKGLAVALDRPIVGVPSLAGLARVRAGGRRRGRPRRRPRGVPAAPGRGGAGDRRPRPAGEASTGPLVAAGGADRCLRAGRCRPAAARRRRRGTSGGRPSAAMSPTGDDLSRLEPAYLRAPRGVAQRRGGRELTWRSARR